MFVGGCKHAVAFLMWAYRKSEEPSRTDIQCYWKKSKLASVGTNLKFITVEQMGGVDRLPQPLPVPSNGQFLKDVVGGLKSSSSSSILLKYVGGKRLISDLSLHHLLRQFLKEGMKTPTQFIDFCKINLTQELYKNACNQTKEQCNSKLWHELRYGRITASRLHEVARCKTATGTLTETIIGSLKIKETESMKRGKTLESRVRKELEKQIACKFENTGLMIYHDYPNMGASPDAINDEFVVEIKCPSTEKSVSDYVNDGQLTNKCKAQIQMQMHIFKKNKGIFCVADPGFEINKQIYIYHVDYDQEYVESLIHSAHIFWCKNIFPLLTNALE